MSDPIHKDVPAKDIHHVFAVTDQTLQHTFQILTKRPQQLLELDPALAWADHIWMGVSVENAACRGRIDLLRRPRARVKFLSMEPLIGRITGMNLEGINWVIVEGESGPNARPVQEARVTESRDQCLAADVRFFFK